MNGTPRPPQVYGTPRPDPSRRRAGRPVVVVLAVLVVLLGLGLGGVYAVDRFSGDSTTEPLWQAGPLGTPAASGAPTASPEPTAAKSISMTATGDIIMGSSPNRLPPNGGKGFFDDVAELLRADLVMGNLEEPITEDTGVRKCAEGSTKCHQFRVPPSYAKHLKDAGFEVLNQANNHGYDYGPAGYENTQEALEEHGMRHTGAPDQITVVDVEGVSVAVVGFSSYAWSNSLTDVDSAKAVIEKAAGQADLVVVQVHMGAEGSGMIHVKKGTEMFVGENRGDPIKFSHAVIDAGADLVVGHGPHVLRGMEFYKGRLIAYSLGNFAGAAGTLGKSGRLGYAGVLKVSMTADGTFVDGSFASTRLNSGGLPVADSSKTGLKYVKELSASDFPSTGPGFDKAGKISEPAG